MYVCILNRIDPLRKQAERGPDDRNGLSPMDPPDAYAPPNLEPVPAQALHSFLRKFRDEHVPFIQEPNAFEEAMLFPMLHERLIANGEHGGGIIPTTATDVMEDEHAKAIQLALWW